MAYNPASGYYGNSGLFSPIPVGMRVGPRYQPPEIPWAGYSPGGPTPESYKAAERAEFKNLADIESRYQNPNFYFGIPSSDQKALTSDYLGAMGRLSRPQRLDYYDFLQETSRQPSRFQENEPPVDIEKFPGLEYYINPDKFKFDKNNIWAGQPYQVANLGFTPPPRTAPFDAIIHQEPALTYSEKIAKDFSSWDEKAAERQALLDDDLYQLARQQDLQALSPQAAQAPAAPVSVSRDVPEAEHYFGIDAPRTASMPSSAYTKSELDAITRAEEAQAKAEESKSFMERLGFTQPTAAEQRPAFHWLDPNAYFDPTGAGAFNIAQGRSGLINTDPLSLGLFAAAAAPGIPPAFGPLSTAFMGITEKMAEARAVDRTREMYGLPTTKSYQRDYQPSWAYTAPPSWVSDLMNKANLTDLEKEQVEGYLGKAGSLASGIGSFFGFGGQPLFDEEELYDLDFAGHLGDVGAETLTYGDHSRAAPDYSGTTGYAPGERAYDRYTHHYTQALDEYNRNMTQAMQMPESPEKADLISYYSRLHPNLREREFDEKAFQDSAWERGEWDFTLDPVTYPSGESTVGWTDPEDLNDPNKGLVDPVTGLMYTAALDRMNPDFDKLLDVNERIDAARLSGIAEREEEEDKTEREALEQMEESRGGSSIPSDPGYSDEVASWGESIGGGW